MAAITLDDNLKSKLNGLDQTIAVQTPEGKTVGQFIPQSLNVKMVYAWSRTAVTDEELDADDQRAGGESLGDILKQLGTE